MPPSTADQALSAAFDVGTQSIKTTGAGGTPPTRTPLRASGTADLSAAALALTSAFAKKILVKAVTIKADAVMTQTATVTLDSKTGASYDVILDSQDMVAATDYVWIPDGDLFLDAGDEILVECTAAGAPAVNVYAEILAEEVS